MTTSNKFRLVVTGPSRAAIIKSLPEIANTLQADPMCCGAGVLISDTSDKVNFSLQEKTVL